MDNTKFSNRKAIVIFLLITFALSLIVWLSTINAQNTGSFGFRVYGYGIMWCPALAAYLSCKILGRNFSDLAWEWGKSKYITWSYLIPLFYALIGYSAVWLCGVGGFYNKVFVSQMTHELGWQNIPASLFVPLLLILQGTIGILPSMATALGEEIGWRGFLLPELTAYTKSYTKTALASGIIWAVWHYPLLLFGNYNDGAPSWYSSLTFSVGVVSMSFIITWLRIKSNSIWPAVMLHASHNLFVQAFFDPITIHNGHTKYFTGEFGLVLPILSFIIAVYFWRRRKELCIST